MRPYFKKTLSQKVGLVEWLKGKALSSSPSTTKNQSINQSIKISKTGWM
jgi:hypothetical protein